jgi:hypothetical protein
MVKLLTAMFGCSHKRTTFPLTIAGTKRTYVACLDCGREFDYNWPEMQRGNQVTPPAAIDTPQSAMR